MSEKVHIYTEVTGTIRYMDTNRKLLGGERVEVRQREIGLRGSWHSAVVVDVKFGRRVVEYDELLAPDGIAKLREVISLREDIHVNGQALSLRSNDGVSAEKTNGVVAEKTTSDIRRGFLRPMPPTCEKPPQFWRRGLLVDAFYDDAWWEGILLDDLSGSTDVKIRVFFPDEGDELLFLKNDIRISQEWDELSGIWRICGFWSFGEDSSKIDCSILKTISIQKNSAAKRLWRQRKFDCEPAVQREDLSPTSILENNGCSEEEKTCVDLVSRNENINGNGEGTVHGTPTVLRQIRMSAKKFLLNAGWKVEFRIKPSSQRQVSVYVSPSGNKYYTLAAACLGWRKSQNFDAQSADTKSTLLESYKTAEGLARMLQYGPKHQKNGIKEREAESCNSDDEIIANASLYVNEDLKHVIDNEDSPLPEHGNKKNQISVFNEKVKRRKLSIEATEHKCKKDKLSLRDDSTEATEQRCKKGKPSLKDDTKASRGRGGCRMQILLSSPRRQKDPKTNLTKGDLSQFKKSTVLSWLIDKGIVNENQPVCYVNRKDGHVMKKGSVSREGVLCDCCKVIFTLSNFEAHAGSKLHRPSANIFLNDGRSIADCQLQACSLQDGKDKEIESDVSDDTCGVCADGGELILCDHCPSTFHPECIGLEVIPEGDWYCPRCLCSKCGKNKTATDAEDTTFTCVQCELDYHDDCASGYTKLKINPFTEISFCGYSCQQVFAGLRTLVGKANPIDDGFSWMLLRSMREDAGLLPSSIELMAEQNVKLGVAHGVMQECFVPMIDPRTKIDLISQVLYNRKSKVTRLDKRGFYTMILEKADEIISVATIRIHGAKLAEMPLVGTRYQYRRQGMCRRLMNALEQMLESIGVAKLVLPAVPELLETWTGAFGFQQISASETRELRKLNLMTFPGTSLLEKHLRKLECQTENNFEKLMQMQSILEYNAEQMTAGLLNLSIPSFSTPKMDPLYQNMDIEKYNYTNFQSPLASMIDGKRARFRTKISNSTQKSNLKEEDDVMQYARVVRATTRSKRLVKSPKWIADGLRELTKDTEGYSFASTPERNTKKTKQIQELNFNTTQVKDSQSCNFKDKTHKSLDKSPTTVVATAMVYDDFWTSFPSGNDLRITQCYFRKRKRTDKEEELRSFDITHQELKKTRIAPDNNVAFNSMSQYPHQPTMTVVISSISQECEETDVETAKTGTLPEDVSYVFQNIEEVKTEMSREQADHPREDTVLHDIEAHTKVEPKVNRYSENQGDVCTLVQHAEEQNRVEVGAIGTEYEATKEIPSKCQDSEPQQEDDTVFLDIKTCEEVVTARTRHELEQQSKVCTVFQESESEEVVKATVAAVLEAVFERSELEGLQEARKFEQSEQLEEKEVDLDLLFQDSQQQEQFKRNDTGSVAVETKLTKDVDTVPQESEQKGFTVVECEQNGPVEAKAAVVFDGVFQDSVEEGALETSNEPLDTLIDESKKQEELERTSSGVCQESEQHKQAEIQSTVGFDTVFQEYEEQRQINTTAVNTERGHRSPDSVNQDNEQQSSSALPCQT